MGRQTLTRRRRNDIMEIWLIVVVTLWAIGLVCNNC